MKLKITKIPKGSCPYCDAPFSHATGEGDLRELRPGDIEVCMVCIQVACINDEMQLVKMSAQQYAALPEDLRKKIENLSFLLECYKAGVEPEVMARFLRHRGAN